MALSTTRSVMLGHATLIIAISGDKTFAHQQPQGQMELHETRGPAGSRRCADVAEDADVL